MGYSFSNGSPIYLLSHLANGPEKSKGTWVSNEPCLETPSSSLAPESHNSLPMVYLREDVLDCFSPNSIVSSLASPSQNSPEYVPVVTVETFLKGELNNSVDSHKLKFD